jgi:hypothetical protein
VPRAFASDPTDLKILKRAVAAAAFCGLATAHSSARADTVDPSYGRIRGDVTFVVGVGATVAEGGTRGEAELRLRYLETVGLFGAYEDGPIFGASPEPRRAIVGGLEVRPLFLFRWLQGHETQHAWLDLAIDSFGIELGVVGQQPAGTAFASQAAAQFGLAFEVPVIGKGTGPWLGVHGGIRWSEAALASGDARTTDDRAAYLTITLAWHQVVVAHVVDVGDEAPR